MNDIIEFFMDPLRLTLIIAGIVVILAIVIFSRRSNKHQEFTYSGSAAKEFSFGTAPNEKLAKEMLVDEEVILLPKKRKESEVLADAHQGSASQQSAFSNSQARNTQSRQAAQPTANRQSRSVPSFSAASSYEGEPPKTENSRFSSIDEFEAYEPVKFGASSKSNVFGDATKANKIKPVIVDESALAFDNVSTPKKETITRSQQNKKQSKRSTEPTNKKPPVKSKSAFGFSNIRKNEETDNLTHINEFAATAETITEKQSGSSATTSQAEFEANRQTTPQARSTKNASTTTAKSAADEKDKLSSQQAVQSPPVKPMKERFVVLHVIAVEGEPFNGLDILDATKTLGLAFGKHAIFHYPMSAAPSGDSKFCLVNMSQEGNFSTNKMSSLETNGISLIMRLPIRGASCMTVFSNMLGVTHALARKLGGDILDQTRVPLTPEIIESLTSDVKHFEEEYKKYQAQEFIPEL